MDARDVVDGGEIIAPVSPRANIPADIRGDLESRNPGGWRCFRSRFIVTLLSIYVCIDRPIRGPL